MKRKLLVFFLICIGFATILPAQTARRLYSVKGFVYENETNVPIEMALVSLPDLNLWGTTDAKGMFLINRVSEGTTKLEITCLGYQTMETMVKIERNIDSLTFKLKEENLKLQSVTVTATEVKSAINTSTRMDRQAIDHLQVINPTDIMSLLPGGKTVNPNLMTQSVFNIRGGDGNGSFGTAVEVDGIRLSPNSNLSGTTSGVDTRNLSASNFESIEVITGVPSVEYGDMTSGLVVIRTKKGRSGYNVSTSLNPTTKQISLSKGFDLKKDRGILNFNTEYAHAFQNPVSPYTTYFRNGYGLNYSNTFNREGRPVQFNVNLGGTIGRQDAKTDPDAYKDTWSLTQDNAIRFGASANWLINSAYITNLDFRVSGSYKDDLSKNNTYFSYATIKPAINAMENGYHETNYPQDKYRDIMVYSKNYGTQNNYFYVAKTNVFRDFFNPDLEWSRSRNIEFGIDGNIGGIGVSLVYYNNKALNPYYTESFHVPYAYTKTDENYAVPNNPEFRVDKITGEIYVRDKDNPSLGEVMIPKSVTDTLFIQNSMQANGEPSYRQGVELSIDFGRVESIRTSFRFDARYSYSKEVSERLSSSYSAIPHSTIPTNQGRSYEFVAFYMGGTGRNVTYNGSWGDGMTANFTATTHIPEIRMTISLRLEGTLYARSQNLTYYNGKEWAYLVDESGNRVNKSVYDQKEYFSGVWPVAYMGFDQVVKPFTQTEANDPRFAYLIGRSNTIYTFMQDGNGAYFMSNISLTKEIGDLASLSFYVNNFTKSNPYLKSWATGVESVRNIGFAYGATLRFKF